MKNFKSGTYISQGSYKSFQPKPLNREWQIIEGTQTNIEEAFLMNYKQRLEYEQCGKSST
jgi:hypothetical protein